jgi:DNA modification methylase
VEMHRVLKPTGSLFLHCDPTASHYLKLLLDNIFSPKNFRNEIIWERSQPKGHAKLRFSRCHDTIFFYTKSEKSRFNPQYAEHDPAYLEKFYRYVEPETGRRYRLGDLTNPNKERPNLTYEFPPGSGTVRVWRWTKDRMMQAWETGRVVLPEEGGVVREKRYLDEMEGTPIKDIWYDIEHLHGSSNEYMGYQTQKPEALLERIIRAGSNEGDVVFKLNPFQFECWALASVGARSAREKRGADRGIDGVMNLRDEYSGDYKKIILQVKGGHVTVSQVRDLKGVLEREKAEIGVFLTLRKPTRQMRGEADAAGSFIDPQYPEHRFPRLQILTIEDIFTGKKVAWPSWWSQDTFKKGPRRRKNKPEDAQNNLLKEVQEPYLL